VIGTIIALTAAVKGSRITEKTSMTRRRKSMPPELVASGPTDGVTAPRTATAATRLARAGTAAQNSA
jgi:hypothetical protein